MTQLDIFDPRTAVRRTDPSTSHTAARRAREFAKGQCVAIRQCLEDFGPQNAHELGTRLGLDVVQICRRLPDLEKTRLAAPTGDCRPSASGRPMRVWRAI